jgi:hypothetical protein
LLILAAAATATAIAAQTTPIHPVGLSRHIRALASDAFEGSARLRGRPLVRLAPRHRVRRARARTAARR